MNARADIPTTACVLWHRLDGPGHDSARLIEKPDGAVVHGTAVFSESGRPCRLDYVVECDAEWRTVSARVTGWIGVADVAVEIAVDAARDWTYNGRRCPDVQGRDDIDLSFSPATNLLPIRRSRLAIGARVSAHAAWLSFPGLVLEPLEQIYERVSASRFRYESGGGAFVTMLETNASGFVVQYPGMWRGEPAA